MRMRTRHGMDHGHGPGDRDRDLLNAFGAHYFGENRCMRFGGNDADHSDLLQ